MKTAIKGVQKRVSKMQKDLGLMHAILHIGYNSSLAYQAYPLIRKEKHILGLEHKFYKVHMGSYLVPKT